MRSPCPILHSAVVRSSENAYAAYILHEFHAIIPRSSLVVFVTLLITAHCPAFFPCKVVTGTSPGRCAPRRGISRGLSVPVVLPIRYLDILFSAVRLSTISNHPTAGQITWSGHLLFATARLNHEFGSVTTRSSWALPSRNSTMNRHLLGRTLTSLFRSTRRLESATSTTSPLSPFKI
jgi:hypothetical protein